eukprot:NODE_13014_length_491_cov_1.489130_g12721_i0.p1 GENE.NODE_13014_length_491_cov_1.489130_g12721_i0~~NODE_13014_length_491_cov_1.489130_g12721_i0.p1  ORF type:complete len:161 (-),score=23.46 NODE_13014_length_491_cov_1.489130_g12721_i0:8-490(-)
MKVDPSNGDVDPMMFWSEKDAWGGVGLSAYSDVVISRFGLGPQFGHSNNINFHRRGANIADDPTLSTFRKEGETEEMFVEGYRVFSVNTSRSLSITNTADNLAIGGGGWTELSCYNGDIGEIMLYTCALDDQDRSLVEEYLRAKWFAHQCAPSLTRANLC